MNSRFIPQPATVLNWMLAVIFCLLVSMSYMLNGAMDFDGVAERAQADAMEEAHRAERLLQAAQAACADMRGPQAEARFTEDGKLVCIGRRGKPMQIAGGV